jgi:uncharacterized membrane protein YfcA
VLHLAEYRLGKIGELGMDIATYKLVLLGGFAGVASGLLGIGGGVIVVPALMLIWHVAPREASATSLVAMLLPFTALSVASYYKSGVITPLMMKSGAILGVAMMIGGLAGSQLSMEISQQMIKKIFGVFLVLVAIRMWI